MLSQLLVGPRKFFLFRRKHSRDQKLSPFAESVDSSLLDRSKKKKSCNARVLFEIFHAGRFGLLSPWIPSPSTSFTPLHFSPAIPSDIGNPRVMPRPQGGDDNPTGPPPRPHSNELDNPLQTDPNRVLKLDVDIGTNNSRASDLDPYHSRWGKCDGDTWLHTRFKIIRGAEYKCQRFFYINARVFVGQCIMELLGRVTWT